MSSPGFMIFAGTSNLPLAEKIAKSIDISLGILELKRFSDGEIWVKFSENIRGREIFLIQSTNPPAENLVELLIMIDAAKRASAKRITAVIPYFGYARQDRKDQPRVSITAKLMANLITEAGADRAVSYTHLRAHETVLELVCRLLLVKQKANQTRILHHERP